MSSPTGKRMPPVAWSRGNRKFHAVTVFTVVAILLFLFVLPNRRAAQRISPETLTETATGPETVKSYPKPVSWPSIPVTGCSTNITAIRSFGLTGPIKYTRIEAVVREDNALDSIPEHLDAQLPSFHTLNISSEEDYGDDNGKTDSGELNAAICTPKIQVSVPRIPPKVDASHIIVGTATTIDRLYEDFDTFKHWAGHTKVKLIVVIEPSTPGAISEVQQIARDLGIDMTLFQSADEYNNRVFSLTKLMWEHRIPGHTKWAIVIDDDTFFLNMRALVDRLAYHDPTQLRYVGALSEDTVQMSIFGIMAYGGGGISISMPLLEQMNKYYTPCFDIGGTGDGRIAKCIYHFTPATLTWDPDFHQLDLEGDQGGFYETGRRQPLSVHHWKSWFHFDMAKMARMASVCGDQCLLHRWRFADGWMLNGGFSIVKYSKDLQEGDFSLEKTWIDVHQDNGDLYAHALAPLRGIDEEKTSFRLEEAVVEEGGARVRQYYVQRASEDEDTVYGENAVIEMVWHRK